MDIGLLLASEKKIKNKIKRFGREET